MSFSTQNEKEYRMPPPVFLEGRPLPIFPCWANKRPSCPHGFKDAVADAEGIARLWSQYPGPLIGVPTGLTSGVDVIDIDKDHGGFEWLRQNPGLPVTRTHRTRSGGLHLIYRHTLGQRCSVSQIALGVDVRADGGYVIFPPSPGYAVECLGPVADFPARLAEPVTRAKGWPEIKTNGGRGRPVDGMKTDPLPRDLYLLLLKLVPISDSVQSHHQRCVRGLLSVVVHAAEGARNNKLNCAAFKMHRYIEAGIISRTNAEALLMQAAAGLAATDGEHSVWRTIQSGLTAGFGPRADHGVFDRGKA